LLQLDSISSYLRYLCIRLGLDQYPVLLQIVVRQGEGLSARDHTHDTRLVAPGL
jgi:hypothetical protein